jgi:four helix bundle protein
MATIRKFEDLEIWQLALIINRDLYSNLGTKIDTSDKDLWRQINRSAGSIMDNIAEGFERDETRELIYFLSISKASCGEMRSQLYRASERNYANQEVILMLLHRVK